MTQSVLGGPIVGKTTIQTEDNGIMVFDAVTEASHSSTVTVTKNPIESGATINDHFIVMPQKLVLKGVVSNTPISLASSAVGAVSTGVGGALGGVVGALAQFATARVGSDILNGQNSTPNELRNKIAYQIFQELQLSGIPVTIVTNLRVYNNMFLTSIQTNVTSETSQALVTSVTFEEILIGVTDVTEVPKSKVNGSKKSKKQGKKNTKATDEAKVEKVVDCSIFKCITNAADLTTVGSGISGN